MYVGLYGVPLRRFKRKFDSDFPKIHPFSQVRRCDYHYLGCPAQRYSARDSLPILYMLSLYIISGLIVNMRCNKMNSQVLHSDDTTATIELSNNNVTITGLKKSF